MKYKVGDKVRVRKDLRVFHFYDGIDFVAGMHIYRGKTCTVSKIVDGRTYRFKEDKGAWAWSDKMLEPAPICTEKIVITTDGVTTTAERLMAEDKPKYYNGKVVCITSSNNNGFTKGKIYQVTEGVTLDDEGRKRPCTGIPIKTFKDLGGALYPQWVEVAE